MTKIAYYTSIFPTITTTFIQREVNALSSLGGNEILLISNHSPEKGEYHPKDESIKSRTFYLKNVGILYYLKSNFKMFLLHPLNYFKTLKTAFLLNDNFRFQRLTNVLHVSVAAVLYDFLKKNNINHVHVHFAFGSASVALFLNVLSDITYSLSIHGSDVLLKRPLTEEKIKRSDFVISNCNFHISNLKNKYPSLAKKKFHLVRLGVDFNDQLWKNRSKYHDKVPFRILTIGRLVPVKAQDILIKACAVLKEKKIPFVCNIVGTGPLLSELEMLVRKLGLDQCISFFGQAYEQQIAKFYDWTDVFVLSSISEGTPMTIIEAMAKGRPVIGPEITAIPEMIDDGQTGFLFQRESVKHLAEKLMILSENVPLRTAMGRGARCKAEEMFDLNININTLNELFITHISSATNRQTEL